MRAFETVCTVRGVYIASQRSIAQQLAKELRRGCEGGETAHALVQHRRERATARVRGPGAHTAVRLTRLLIDAGNVPGSWLLHMYLAVEGAGRRARAVGGTCRTAGFINYGTNGDIMDKRCVMGRSP